MIVAAVMPLPWIAANAMGGLGLPHVAVAVLAGVSILGAAALISWGAELAVGWQFGEREPLTMPQKLVTMPRYCSLFLEAT